MCLNPDGETGNSLDTRRSVDGIFEDEPSRGNLKITRLLRPPLLLQRQPRRK